ncbi:MAG: hypothetical protein EOO07_00520 [Chitinophagaceae bacterium]|nr:MAG: hypothetical protein EOO07_00520 [Chitinophagaceae bacterium]
MQNPSSYAGINSVTIDVGLSGGFNELRNSTLTENSFNATLSHVALGFNITKRSGLSFGILPYSELGYNFKSTVKLGNTAANQKDVDFLYTGEGGLTKSYLGYGFGIGDHVRVGANIEYVFGNLSESRSTQFVNDPGAISSRMQDRNSVGGVAFSYGAQYDIRIDGKTSLVFGYSGSSASKINSKRSNYVTQYKIDATGVENPAIDTLFSTENSKTNLQLPLVHNFGVTLQKNDKWLIGADYRMGKWSSLTIDNVNQNLQDTYGFSVGGQFVPDFTAINGYFKRVEYRLGFQYDKTYIQMNNQDIKQSAITLGLGLPMSAFNRGFFYKANIAAEIGKRGSIDNGLLQERYVTFHLGFTLNDSSWFRRFKFD